MRASYGQRNSKRQMRLAFTPVPSSSPQAMQYDPQRRERAAAVSLDRSPISATRKKRRTDQTELSDPPDVGIDSDAEVSLPTPEKSSQMPDEESEHGINNGRTSRPETQRTLDYGVMSKQQLRIGKGSTESPATETPKSSKRSAKRLGRSGIFGRDSAGPPQTSDEEDSSSMSRSPSPSPVMKKRRLKPVQSPMSSHATSTAPPRLSRTKSGISPPSTTSRRMQTRSTTKKGLQAPHSVLNQEMKSTARLAPDLVITLSPSSDDEHGDDMPSVLTSRRSRISASARHVVSDEDSDEIVITRTKKLNGPATRGTTESDNQDEDADELPITPARRRRFRTKNLNVAQSQQEMEDIEEDLKFLGSSAGLDAGRSQRSTETPQKSARQKALELLKRRRAGEEEETGNTEDEIPSSSRKRALYDTDTGPSELSDEDEVADESDREVTRREMFHADEDDEGFIASDDEGPLGAPVDLPLEFSHLRHMKIKDLFQFAIEWMVQKKINPAFAISDEVYDLAFKRLDDAVRGLAGSKFTSAAWTPPFTRALQALPDIDYHPIGAATLPDRCDACNRSGHPATWDIRFGGMPYRSDTLEDLSENEDDSEDRDDDPRELYDAKGNVLPNPNITYHVGKFCKQNALTAHALAHWRHHLYSWVVDYLKEAGYCSAQKILERDEWSTKKRRDYANKITDKMKQSGEIANLWRDFRNETDKARNAGQSRFQRSSP